MDKRTASDFLTPLRKEAGCERVIPGGRWRDRWPRGEFRSVQRDGMDPELYSAGARQDRAVFELPRHEHAAGFPVTERPERHTDPHAGQQ